MFLQNLFLVILTFLGISLLAVPAQISAKKFQREKELKLTILHTNDVHSRFLQTNKYSSPCSDSDAENGECFGGFPRLHYKVSEIRRDIPNVAYLSAGDYYQGTVWYTMYKWQVISRFVNILNHTAMTLGNHEFDDGVPGLVPFLDQATFPIVSCNIDDSNEPIMQGKFKKSVVVTYEGVQVGIIGFTTVETEDISTPGDDVIFKNEIESLKEETQRLYDSGVRILIALGHAGYDVDMKIAEQVPLIDVVVGGHTNTFLYTGTPPTQEEVPAGPYPTIVTQPSGRKVPVVQAFAFGKYLGFLNVTFDEEGEVKEWAGNPILMDNSIPQDPELLQVLTTLGNNLTESLREEVGKTHVFLNGSETECRMRECNLGNVITDSMVYANLKYSSNYTYWSDVTISMMSGGGVRASIDEKSRNGSITTEDLMTILPFGNTVDLIEIKGKHIVSAFEFSVDGYDPSGNRLAGKFLQTSGIRVVYDLSQPVNSRVKSLHVLCNRCRVPRYELIDHEVVYKVAIQSYIADGGDGYDVVKDNIISRQDKGLLDVDLMVNFLKDSSPIYTGIEGRIHFHETPPQKIQQKVENLGFSSSSQISTVSFSSIFLILLILVVFNSAK